MFDGINPCRSWIVSLFCLSPHFTWLCDLRITWLCEIADDFTWPSSHVTLLIIVPHQKSTPPGLVVTGLKKLVLRFNLQCKLTGPRDRGVIWLRGWWALILSHQHVEFGGHRPSESGDINLSCSRNLLWLCG